MSITMDDMLALARHYVLNARRIVDRQRRAVEALDSAGRDATEARKTLDLFERTLNIFEDHLRRLTEGANARRWALA